MAGLWKGTIELTALLRVACVFWSARPVREIGERP
jgi:hypothetical protein